MTCADFIELLFSGLIALVGAGAGAYFAYRFAMKQQQDNERKTEYRSAMSAMLTLYSRFAVLQTFRRNTVTEDGTSIIPEREFALMSQYVPDTKLDFASLGFLADAVDSGFVHDLSLFEANFFNFFDGLRERHEYLGSIVNRSIDDDGHTSDGKSVVMLKSIEKNLVSAQNRNLVFLAVLALELNKKCILSLKHIMERRFQGLPVFTPSALAKEIKKS